jgi:hypothetical protein
MCSRQVLLDVNPSQFRICIKNVTAMASGSGRLIAMSVGARLSAATQGKRKRLCKECRGLVILQPRQGKESSQGVQGIVSLQQRLQSNGVSLQQVEASVQKVRGVVILRSSFWQAQQLHKQQCKEWGGSSSCSHGCTAATALKWKRLCKGPGCGGSRRLTGSLSAATASKRVGARSTPYTDGEVVNDSSFCVQDKEKFRCKGCDGSRVVFLPQPRQAERSVHWQGVLGATAN